MAVSRDIRVEIGEDYLLSLSGGALYLWERGEEPRIVPVNEAARSQMAATPTHSAQESMVQVFLLGSTRRLALACLAEQLSDGARALVRAVLARELPDATPVFLLDGGPGSAVAVSAPLDGTPAPDAGDIAACVAVMKASCGWDETRVMAIEADGVRCTVDMFLGDDVRDVRVTRFTKTGAEGTVRY